MVSAVHCDVDTPQIAFILSCYSQKSVKLSHSLPQVFWTQSPTPSQGPCNLSPRGCGGGAGFELQEWVKWLQQRVKQVQRLMLCTIQRNQCSRPLQAQTTLTAGARAGYRIGGSSDTGDAAGPVEVGGNRASCGVKEKEKEGGWRQGVCVYTAHSRHRRAQDWRLDQLGVLHNYSANLQSKPSPANPEPTAHLDQGTWTRSKWRW